MAGTSSPYEDLEWPFRPAPPEGPPMEPELRPAAAAPRPRTAPAARPATGRRKHPSHGARIVALTSSVAATVGVGAALAYADSAPARVAAAVQVGASSTGSTAAATAATTTAIGQYADGTYTGGAEYTRWGNYQVQVTIKNGKIVSVQETQAPSDPRSSAINDRAAPVLESQAVAQQNANLDIVSGATYTSRTYAASLQSALDQAAPSATASGS